MASTSMATHRGDYGFDAPYVFFVFVGVTLAAIGCAVAGIATRRPGLERPALVYAIVFGAIVASWGYTTRRGKFVVWSRLLGSMAWRGDERVLDLGCGRGAVLTMTAKCLTSGTVTGADIWKTSDQSGSSERVCRRNADLEGVGDRVAIRTADMRDLPFADASFDVIVSSLAIHNIPSKAGRMAALGEAARVLAPGGRLAIADIRHTRAYAAELRRLGLVDVARRGLGWRFWYGSPFGATALVTARKGERPA
ncbi:MAG TPA: class I SAM-dependent methyltransferase [Vicinamibacterales bacterium]|nr:class I SAM-dependent methyltransferase [Vicinamibacterales bacterium]